MTDSQKVLQNLKENKFGHFCRMEDDRNNETVKREHTVAAINILTAKQGHPPLSDVQINMVQEMVLNHNSLNQLATGKAYSGACSEIL